MNLFASLEYHEATPSQMHSYMYYQHKLQPRKAGLPMLKPPQINGTEFPKCSLTNKTVNPSSMEQRIHESFSSNAAWKNNRRNSLENKINEIKELSRGNKPEFKKFGQRITCNSSLSTRNIFFNRLNLCDCYPYK